MRRRRRPPFRDDTPSRFTPLDWLVGGAWIAAILLGAGRALWIWITG